MDGRQAISITNGEFGRLAERSLAIHERNEFERWCRRDLQGFLPHTTLLCARGDLLLDSHQIEHLFEPPDAEIDDTQRRESEETLLGALLAAWRHRHGVPLVIRPQDMGKGTRRSALAAELARHGYRDCSAHGLLDQESGAGAFFVFLDGLNEPRESRARRLELLVPHLYATLQRVPNLPVNFTANITAGKAFPIGDAELGVIATVGISNKWTNRDAVQQTSLSADLSTLESDFRRVTTMNRMVVNGLLGLAFRHRFLWLVHRAFHPRPDRRPVR